MHTLTFYRNATYSNAAGTGKVWGIFFGSYPRTGWSSHDRYDQSTTVQKDDHAAGSTGKAGGFGGIYDFKQQYRFSHGTFQA